MKTLRQIFGVLYIYTSLSQVSPECSDGWVTFGTSCYLFDHNPLHFTEAQAFCKQKGARLVHIETMEENLFLQSFIADIKVGRYWIGLTDHVIEGIWRWTDTNTAGTYTGWYPGQPDGKKGANCVAIHENYRYEWVDVACGTGHNAVCEIKCLLTRLHKTVRDYSTSTEKEYAIEMACSNIRYGLGVTKEVGMDCKNMGAKNVLVVTDARLAKMQPVQTVIQSLENQNVNYKLYDRTRVEPTDESFQDCIDFAKAGNFDLYLAVGGGSVIDTCKAANLFASKPDAELLDFVNAPIGKGTPITHSLKPLIAVTTTAGTGSETTGTAVFDYLPMKAKTGIASRALRPTLGIVDPEHLVTVPERVTCYTGLDVLCHAIESYTCKPFDQRTPRPDNPLARPSYQGSNPISDIWSLHALRMTSKYIKRATFTPDDYEARGAMHLASAYAGVGFGNAGCHLPHGMSYPISGNVTDYKAEGYEDLPLIPHGLSVIVSSPAVFEFTASACPERHLEALEALDGDVTNVKREDAGKALADRLREILIDLKVPDGLASLGYDNSVIKTMVDGAMPQHRLVKLSPRECKEEDMAKLFENSMKIY